MWGFRLGGSTMRKTFAWNYYKATNDIFYLQNLLNHASPSITYRYIDENPVKKRTPKNDQRSRFLLDQNDNGKKEDPAFGEHAGGYREKPKRTWEKRCLFWAGWIVF